MIALFFDHVDLLLKLIRKLLVHPDFFLFNGIVELLLVDRVQSGLNLRLCSLLRIGDFFNFERGQLLCLIIIDGL